MATRVNMLKFLQESRGLADFTSRNPQPRLPGPLALPLRFTKSAALKQKRLIPVKMQLQPDFPEEVPIRHAPLPPAPGLA